MGYDGQGFSSGIIDWGGAYALRLCEIVLSRCRNGTWLAKEKTEIKLRDELIKHSGMGWSHIGQRTEGKTEAASSKKKGES